MSVLVYPQEDGSTRLDVALHGEGMTDVPVAFTAQAADFQLMREVRVRNQPVTVECSGWFKRERGEFEQVSVVAKAKTGAVLARAKVTIEFK